MFLNFCRDGRMTNYVGILMNLTT